MSRLSQDYAQTMLRLCPDYDYNMAMTITMVIIVAVSYYIFSDKKRQIWICDQQNRKRGIIAIAIMESEHQAAPRRYWGID